VQAIFYEKAMNTPHRTRAKPCFPKFAVTEFSEVSMKFRTPPARPTLLSTQVPQKALRSSACLTISSRP
jgi:hypothetical protein